MYYSRRMSLNKQKTKKPNANTTVASSDPLADILVKGTFGMNMPVDEYAEKHRPNLYIVLKKLKESAGGQLVHRLCYLARVNEQEFKGDIEKEMIQWTK